MTDPALSATFAIIGTLTLGNFSPQAGNAFTTTADPPAPFAVINKELFKFKLTAAGEPVDLSGLTFSWSSAGGGVVAADVANVTLMVGASTYTPSSPITNTTMTFGAISVPVGTQDCVLKGDVASLVLGDSMTISNFATSALSASTGSTSGVLLTSVAGAVNGGPVAAVTHTANGYTVSVSGAGYPTLDAGSSATITWTAVGSPTIGGNVKLEYSTNGGGTYSLVQETEGTPNDGIVENDGNFSWAVPAAALSTQVEIRVTHAVETTAKGVSSQFAVRETLVAAEHPAGQATNAFPTVVAPFDNLLLYRFALSAANGAVQVTQMDLALAGSQQLTDSDFESVELIKDLDADGIADAGEPVVSAGTVSLAASRMRLGTAFTISGTASYLIRASLSDIASGDSLPISLTMDSASVLTSGATSGVPAGLSGGPVSLVTHAKAGYAVALKDRTTNTVLSGPFTVQANNVKITWIDIGNAPIGGTVTLEYSTNGFADESQTIIINAATPNDGTENWTIPDAVSETVAIRITHTTDPFVKGVSGAFAIKGSLTLIAPVGGETWLVGDATRTITWDKLGTYPAGTDNVMLEYTTDGTVASPVWTMILASTPNDGSEPWTIPDAVSTKVKVRITHLADSTVQDVSGGLFTIAGTLELAAHSQGQAENAFTTIPQVTGKELFRFRLKAVGEVVDLSGIRFTWSGTNVAAGELRNLTLSLGQTPVGGAAQITGTTGGTIAFGAVSVPVEAQAGPQELVLKGDVVGLALSDALTIGLDTAGLLTPRGADSNVNLASVGGLSGAVSSAVHTASGYGVSLDPPQAVYKIGDTVTVSWIKLGSPGDSVLVDYLVGGTDLGNCGGQPTTATSCTFTFPNTAAARDAAVLRVQDANKAINQGFSPNFTVAGMLALEEPAAQAANAFTTSPTVTDGELFRFRLRATGEAMDVTGLTVTLSGVSGIDTAEVSAQLLRDDGATLTAVGGSGAVAIDPATGTGTISFGGVVTVPAGAAVDFVVRATVNMLAVSDAMTLGPMSAADLGSVVGADSQADLVALGAVSGATMTTASHLTAGYDVTLTPAKTTYKIGETVTVSWTKVGTPGNAVNVEYLVNGVASGTCGSAGQTSPSCAFTFPAAATAPGVAQLRVTDASNAGYLGLSAPLTIAGTLQFGAHSAGPAPDALTGIPSVSNKALYQFALTATGEGVMLDWLTLEWSSAGIVCATYDAQANRCGDLSNVTLIRGATEYIPVSMDASTVSFRSVAVPAGAQDFVLRGDVGNLALGDSMTFELTDERNVTPLGALSGVNLKSLGAVTGSVAGQTHTVSGYDVVIRDSADTTTLTGPFAIGETVLVKWTKYGSAGSSVTVDYVVGGVDRGNCGTQPTSATSCTFTMPSPATDPGAAQFVVQDAGASYQGQSPAFTVAGTLAIEPHSQGQAGNALSLGSVSSKELYKFRLKAIGEPVDLSSLTIPWSGSGVTATDLSNILLLVGATPYSPSQPPTNGAITFGAIGIPEGGVDAVLKADVAGLELGETMTIGPLTTNALGGPKGNRSQADLGPLGALNGTLASMTHTVKGYLVTLSPATAAYTIGQNVTISWTKVGDPGDEVTVDYLVGGAVIGPVCDTIGQTGVSSCAFTFPNAATAPAAAQFKVTDAARPDHVGLSSGVTVKGTLTLAQHAAGQAANALITASSSVSGVALLRLRLTATGEDVALGSITLPLSGLAGGLDPVADIPAASLALAAGAGVTIPADATYEVFGAPQPRIVITFPTSPLRAPAGEADFILTGEMRNLQPGKAVAIGLSPSDLGGVIGARSLEAITPTGAIGQNAAHRVPGTLALGAHTTLPQAPNALVNPTNGAVTNRPLFRFSLRATGEDITVGSITFQLSGVNGIIPTNTAASDIRDLALTIGGIPATFTTDLSATQLKLTFASPVTIATGAARNAVLTGSVVNLAPGDAMTLGLSSADFGGLIGVDSQVALASASVTGTVAPAAHLVPGTLALGEPSAQARNALTILPAAPVADLFSVKLTASSEDVTIDSLAFTFSGTGIATSDLSGFELWQDGTVVTALASDFPPAPGSIAVAQPVTIAKGPAGSTFTLRAQVGGLVVGDRMTIGMTTAGLVNPMGATSGIAISASGQVTSKTHIISTYTISLDGTDLSASNQIAVGRTLSITWTPVNANAPAAVEYTLDSGATWSAIAGCTLSAGSCAWTIPTSLSASAAGAAQIRLRGTEQTDGQPISATSGAFTVTGALTLAEHASGQPANAFVELPTVMGAELYRFRLTPAGEDVHLLSLTFDLSSVVGIDAAHLTALALYQGASPTPLAATIAVNPSTGAPSKVVATLSGVTLPAGTPADFTLKGSVDNLDAPSGVADEMSVSLSTNGIGAQGARSQADLSAVAQAVAGLVSAKRHFVKTYLITVPAAGASWPVNTSQQISWTPVGGASAADVTISYTTNGGATYTQIASAADVANPYPWLIPIDAISTQAKIKITDRADSAVLGYSGGSRQGSFFNIAGRVMLLQPAADARYTDGLPRWPVGAPQTIQWAAVGPMSQFTVFLNGAEMPGSPTSAMSLPFTPASPSASSTVRVADATPNHPTAEATAGVVLSQVQLTQPSATSVWLIGSGQTIQWTQTGLQTVDLLYRVNGGAWQPIRLGDNAAQASATWTVPPEARSPATEILIRDGIDPQIGASHTAGPFKVYGRLQLAPISGVAANVQTAVTWTTTPAGSVPSVALYLIDVARGSTSTIIANQPNTGSFNWTPAQATAQAKIRICDSDFPSADPDACQESGIFSITGITVDQVPAGSYIVGTTLAVSWAQEGLSGSQVRLAYSPNGGTSWKDMAGAACTLPCGTLVSTGPTGSYTWTIPNDLSRNVLVRVADAGGQAFGVSNAFGIAGKLTVKEPKPPKNFFLVGSEMRIRWDTVGAITKVRVDYSLDNGGTWTSIATGITNNNDFRWNPVPTTVVSNNMLVRVVDADGIDPGATHPYTEGRSDTAGLPPIQVGAKFSFAAPVGGERWAVNSQQPVGWSVTGGGVTSVKLAYSTDGTTYTDLALKAMAGTSEETATHAWTIPDIVAALGDPQLAPSRPVTLRLTDETAGHPASPAVSLSFDVIYFKVDWEIRDVSTTAILSNLQVTDSTGWTNAPEFNLSGLQTRYYPFLAQVSTLWSLANNNGASNFSQRLQDPEPQPLDIWASDRDQTRVVLIEVVTTDTVTWQVRSQSHYDAAANTVEISVWLEKSGKVVDTFLTDGFVELYEDGALIRTLPQPMASGPGLAADPNGNFRFIWDLKRADGTDAPDGKTYFAKTIIRRLGRMFSTGGALNITVPKKILTGSTGSGAGTGVTLTELQTELAPIATDLGGVKSATVGPASTLEQIKTIVIPLPQQLTDAQGAIQADIANAQVAIQTDVAAVQATADAIKAETDLISTQVIPKIDGVQAYLSDPDSGLPKLLEQQRALRRGGLLERDLELEQGENATIRYRAVTDAMPPSISIFDPLGGLVTAPMTLVAPTLWQYTLSAMQQGEYRVMVTEPSSADSAGTIDSAVLTAVAPRATAQGVTGISTLLSSLGTQVGTIESKLDGLVAQAAAIQASADAATVAADTAANRAQQLLDKWGTLSAQDLQSELTNLTSLIGTPATGTLAGDIAAIPGALDYSSRFDTMETALTSLSTQMGAPAQQASVDTLLSTANAIQAGMARDADLQTALGRLDALQTSLTGLDAKVGTPAFGSLAADLADVKTAIANMPSAADYTNRFNALDATLTSLGTTMGTPAQQAELATALAQLSTIQTDMAKGVDLQTVTTGVGTLITALAALDARIGDPAQQAALDAALTALATIQTDMATEASVQTVVTAMGTLQAGMTALTAAVGTPAQAGAIQAVQDSLTTLQAAVAAIPTTDYSSQFTALQGGVNALATTLGTPATGSLAGDIAAIPGAINYSGRFDGIDQALVDLQAAVAAISGGGSGGGGGGDLTTIQTSVDAIRAAIGTPSGTTVVQDLSQMKTDMAKEASLAGLAQDATVAKSAELAGLAKTSDLTTLATQASVDNVNAKLGAPTSGTIAGDIAAIPGALDYSSRFDTMETALTSLSTQMGAPAQQASVDTLLSTANAIQAGMARDADLQTALGRLDALQTSLTGLDAKVGTPAFGSLAADLADVKTAIANMPSAADYTNRFNALDATLTSLGTTMGTPAQQAELATALAQLSTIQTDMAKGVDLQTVTTGVGTLITALAALDARIGDPAQQAALDAALTALATIQTDMATEASVQTVVTAMGTLQAGMTALTAAVGTPAQAGAIQAVQDSLTTLQAAVAAIPTTDYSSQFTALQGGVNALATTLGTPATGSLAGDITAIPGATNYSPQLAALQNDLTALSTVVNDSAQKSRLEDAIITLDTIRTQVQALPAANHAGNFAAIDGALDSLSGAVDALKTDLAGLPKTAASSADAATLLSRLDALQQAVESAQGSSAAVGLSQAAYSAASEALKILQQLQTQIRANGAGSAVAHVLLGQFGDQITQVTQGVSQVVTVFPEQSGEAELAEQIKKLAEQAEGLASDKGYAFDSLYEMSQTQSTDVKTMRNQVEELKALLEVQRAILEKNMNQPIMKTWFEAR